MRLSYVLPLKWQDARDTGEMTAYLTRLSEMAEVLVVDGSPDAIFSQHRESWGGLCRHIRPSSHLQFLNGKVNGVLTGLREAANEHVVIADDDVRYTPEALEKIDKLLTVSDLALPQNYFEPLVWHAHWDTARILLNRAFFHDYPGTLGVRRSFMLEAGGYNGDVLFENLELIRTVRACGGTVAHVPDLFVRRLPPSARQFWSQRMRQAYDDLAQPWRLLFFLALIPAGGLVAGRSPRLLASAAVASVVLAETGRRRDSGRDVFRPVSSLLAPLWVLERATCVWTAVAQRLILGGCRYGNSVIPRAATPLSELRSRVGRRGVAHSVAAEPKQLV